MLTPAETVTVLIASSTANVVVASLILTFITIPTVLLVLDRLREGRPGPPARQPAEPSTDEGQSDPSPSTLAELQERDPIRPEEAIRLVDPASVSLPVLKETQPEQLAFAEPNRPMAGDLSYRGFLCLGPGADLDGDVEVQGSLTVGEGVRLDGDVDVTGNLYLDRASEIEGRVRVQGELHMEPWSEVEELAYGSVLHMAPGSRIHGRVRARRIVQDREDRGIRDAAPRSVATLPSFASQDSPAASGHGEADELGAGDLDPLAELTAAFLDDVLSETLGRGWARRPEGTFALRMLAPSEITHLPPALDPKTDLRLPA